mgnify:CR=1 FL=1
MQKLFFLTGLDNLEWTSDEHSQQNRQQHFNAALSTSSFKNSGCTRRNSSSKKISRSIKSAIEKEETGGGSQRRYRTRQFHASSNASHQRPYSASACDDGGDGDMEMLRMHEQYQVSTTGLAHSILILRLLLGHPDFFDKIFNRFEVVTSSGTKE